MPPGVNQGQEISAFLIKQVIVHRPCHWATVACRNYCKISPIL